MRTVLASSRRLVHRGRSGVFFHPATAVLVGFLLTPMPGGMPRVSAFSSACILRSTLPTARRGGRYADCRHRPTPLLRSRSSCRHLRPGRPFRTSPACQTQQAQQHQAETRAWMEHDRHSSPRPRRQEQDANPSQRSKTAGKRQSVITCWGGSCTATTQGHDESGVAVQLPPQRIRKLHAGTAVAHKRSIRRPRVTVARGQPLTPAAGGGSPIASPWPGPWLLRPRGGVRPSGRSDSWP